MGCGASSSAAASAPGHAQPALVQATPALVRHRASNWSHATPGGPGHGASCLWLTVDGAGVQLLSDAEQLVARMDLYTIQSWRGTPNQLLLQMTDGQVVSFDMASGGYGVVGELERVCHSIASQQPVVAVPAAVAVAPAAAGAPAAPAATSIDTSAVERGVAGCVTRLQEQMALRWLAVAAEVARLRAAAEATAASATMLDGLAAGAAPEDTVSLGTTAGPGGGESAAGREGRVCSACTFENESRGERCTMCGCSLSPVVVSIPAGSSAGSSAAAAAALAAAAEVVAEAVEAEDVSWLTGALASLQESEDGGSAATKERLATLVALSRWLEVAEERCLAWKCVGESLSAGAEKGNADFCAPFLC